MTFKILQTYANFSKEQAIWISMYVTQ